MERKNFVDVDLCNSFVCKTLVRSDVTHAEILYILELRDLIKILRISKLNDLVEIFKILN